ncbi:hypothetical protein [Saccharopolyspora aridisoli]|uniref:hypothetical protein n=1 Tax=Saccharopolyspora aridisoli TaxID=2530385 RepID=UPI001404BA98|nr:hypothetical protein [Saccharopolyspora aridisoli]
MWHARESSASSPRPFGTLQLARAVAGPSLSDAILDQGLRNALAILDDATPN